MIAVVSVGSVRAELVWEARELSPRVRAGDAEVTAVYRFVNRGPGTVTIQNLQPSCGCTTAELAKKSYRRGERGEVVAKFVFGGKTGEQINTIVVHSDDPRESRTVLTLRVEIPKVAVVTPTMLFWTPDDRATKVVMVDVLRDEPLGVSGVAASSERVKWKLRTIEAGRRYAVEVEPLPPEAGSLEYLTITTEPVDGAAVTYKVFLKKADPRK
jgi:hypothetical protein